MIYFKYFLCVSLSVLSVSCMAQKKTNRVSSSAIMPAAQRLDQYLPLLKDKNIAVFANQTSMVGNTHLVDTLKKLGIKIKVIFGPEHGFRGTAEAGAHVDGGHR